MTTEALLVHCAVGIVPHMTDESSKLVPRAFISYSWSSPTHEAWVIGLATRLREDGVDVVLDKWDLKPGHDAYQFMESMVTDKAVTKVMMICDKTYVEKANIRAGGVGTESQIISPDLYGKAAQDKYAALMTDEDENGQAHVPVFYRGRIYFDFRSNEKFEDSYEQLLRWLVDRPQHVKPKLGSVPESILTTAPTASATQSRARRAEEAVRQGTNGAAGLVREYGESLLGELKLLAPQEQPPEPFDETIVQAIAAMRPYIRQFSQLVSAILRFGNDPRLWDRVLAIHEQLGTLMFRSQELTRWNKWQFDAYKIISHDAFLTTIALALDEERFDLVEAALAKPYLIRDRDGANRPATSNFTIFNQHTESFEGRKQRLKLNRTSLQADNLKEAYPHGSGPSFDDIMQADFILYLRSLSEEGAGRWYPYALIYACDRYSSFPIFARAESRTYFDKIISMLGMQALGKFKERIAEINDSPGSSQMFNYHGLPVSYLANAEHVGILS